MLSSAAKTPSVKRFVLTSSQATMPSLTEPGTITGSSWAADADSLIAEAWAGPSTADKGPLVYVASKISTERAAWDFIKQERPGFVFNSVIPGLVFGNVIHPKLVSSSQLVVLGFMNDDPASVGLVNVACPSTVINSEDCALLHLAALMMDNVKNQRLLAMGEAVTHNLMVDALKRVVPGSNVPA
jgi:nucleoside-diphosphate-sugar epimerase